MKQKKLISAIIALVMAYSMSVSVCAVDYGSSGGGGSTGGGSVGGGAASPVVTTTPSTDTSDSSGSGETAAEANFEEVAVADLEGASANVTAAAVESAIESGEAITITAEHSNITARAVQMIAQSDKPVTFVSAICTITIDPATITNIGAIDLGMTVTASKSTGEAIIQPSMSGAFGMELQLTFPKSSLGGIDPKGKELVYVSDSGKEKSMGTVKTNKKGDAVITIDHASHYLIRPYAEDISAGAGLDGDGDILA